MEDAAYAEVDICTFFCDGYLWLFMLLLLFVVTFTGLVEPVP